MTISGADMRRDLRTFHLLLPVEEFQQLQKLPMRKRSPIIRQALVEAGYLLPITGREIGVT
jgi:hypothetical protein